MALAIYKDSEHQCQLLPDDDDEAHGAVNSSFLNCGINPGHGAFIPASEFKKEHLPPIFQTTHGMARMKNKIDRTVRIEVGYTSPGRPDKLLGSKKDYPFVKFRGTKRARRCGTGYLLLKWFNTSSFNHPCPCPECKASPQPKVGYWKYEVTSATHVIYDKSEAEDAVFELFFDSDDREGVRYLYGVDVKGMEYRRFRSDRCDVVCITHDPELAATLNQLVSFRYAPCPSLKDKEYRISDSSSTGILVSHPHGVSKRISIGRVHFAYKVSTKEDKSIVFREGCKYRNRTGTQQKEKTQPLDDRGTSNTNPKFDDASRERSNPSSKDGGKEKLQEATSSKSFLGSVTRPNAPTSQISSQKAGESKSKESISLESRDSILPFRLTAIPSPTSKYKWRFALTSDPIPRWVSFPEGTKFVTEDGIAVDVLPETEFDWIDAIDDAPSTGPCYITYDIATCPGSSGAPVFCVGNVPEDQLLTFNHFGCRGGGGNKNNSGLDHWYDIDDDDDDELMAG